MKKNITLQGDIIIILRYKTSDVVEYNYPREIERNLIIHVPYKYSPNSLNPELVPFLYWYCTVK